MKHIKAKCRKCGRAVFHLGNLVTATGETIEVNLSRTRNVSGINVNDTVDSDKVAAQIGAAKPLTGDSHSDLSDTGIGDVSRVKCIDDSVSHLSEKESSHDLSSSLQSQCSSLEIQAFDSKEQVQGLVSDQCAGSVWYMNADSCPDWTKQLIEEAIFTRGKIYCPKCGGRLGGFDFLTSSHNDCGNHTVPPIHFVKSRVDLSILEVKVPAVPQRRKTCLGQGNKMATEDEHCVSRDGLMEAMACLPDTLSQGSCDKTSQETATELPSLSPDQFAENLQISGEITGSRDILVQPDASKFRDLHEESNTVMADNERALTDPDLYRTVETYEGDQMTDSEATVALEQIPRVSSSVEEQGLEQMQPVSSISRGQDETLTDVEYLPADGAGLGNEVQQSWYAENGQETDNFPESEEQVLHDLDYDAEVEENPDVDPVMDSMTCPVCLDVLYQPHSCDPCKHIFCSPCLRRLHASAGSSTKCPLCRVVIVKCRPRTGLQQQVKATYPAQYKERRTIEKKHRHRLAPLPGVAMSAFQYLQMRQRNNYDGTRYPSNVLAMWGGVCFVVLLMMLAFTVFATTVGFVLWYIMEVALDVVAELAVEVNQFCNFSWQALILLCIEGTVPEELNQIIGETFGRILGAFTRLVNRTKTFLDEGEAPPPTMTYYVTYDISTNGTSQFLTKVAQANVANYILLGGFFTYFLYRIARYLQRNQAV